MSRLVPDPVFVISAPRSGSTLLRCVLNSHSEILAPHELHLRHITVEITNEHARLAMRVLGEPNPRYLLWDGIFHRVLAYSPKKIMVDKSPCNVWIIDELRECWPGARFVFLRRDPILVVDSLVEAGHQPDLEAADNLVCRVADLMDAAEADIVGGVSLTYEDLVADPVGAVSAICDFLGVRFEPAMLAYGDFDQGPLLYGLGDTGSKIRSGGIRPARSFSRHSRPSRRLVQVRRRWGYEEAHDSSP